MVCVGLLFFVFVFAFYDRKNKLANNTQDNLDAETQNKLVKNINDTKTLISILNCIDTSIIDETIQHGAGLFFYLPIMDLSEQIDGLNNSSSFHIENENIKNIFVYFYQKLSKFSSRRSDGTLTETATDSLLRLKRDFEIFKQTNYDKYKDDYLTDVKEFYLAYKKLMDYIKKNHPSINFDETNKNYRKLNKAIEQRLKTG